MGHHVSLDPKLFHAEVTTFRSPKKPELCCSVLHRDAATKNKAFFFFLLFSLIVAIAESGVICTTGLCEQEHTLQGACWIRNWGLGLQRPQKQTSPIIRINLGPKTVSYCYYWRVEGNPHSFYELILGTMVTLTVYDQITYFNYTSLPSWDLEIIMKNFYIHRCIFPQEIPTSAKKQIIPRPTHPGNVRPDSVINSIKEK